MAVTRQFTPQARQAIEAFVASMQFPSMPPPASDGSYNFIFEHSGVLSLLPATDGQEIVMILGRKPISDDELLLRRHFAQSALEAMTSGPLHAGMTETGLFCYATRIPLANFDLPTLEANLQQLMAAHQAVA